MAQGEESLYEMFLRVAKSNARVKSQQIGETDFTVTKKVEILKELYQKNQLSFIYRFGKYLQEKDLDNFHDDNNYELNYYISKFRSQLNPNIQCTRVKNRRYNYLNKVLKVSNYFSDDEMQYRNPLLYKQYIGQFITDEENASRKAKDFNQQTFSQFLFSSIDKDIRELRCTLETEMQEEQEEEEDSDSENEEINQYMKGNVPVTDDERQSLREEFIALMEKSFINGEDDFDYRTVDEDETYDDFNDQDLEDRYFDAD